MELLLPLRSRLSGLETESEEEDKQGTESRRETLCVSCCQCMSPRVTSLPLFQHGEKTHRSHQHAERVEEVSNVILICTGNTVVSSTHGWEGGQHVPAMATSARRETRLSSVPAITVSFPSRISARV